MRMGAAGHGVGCYVGSNGTLELEYLTGRDLQLLRDAIDDVIGGRHG